jgi:hypothetical protein
LGSEARLEEVREINRVVTFGLVGPVIVAQAAGQL